MANPLPKENEFYEQIKNERISISPDIWDLLYNRIGDDVSAINLLCQFYLNEKQPLPALEAKKILSYTHHIKNIVNEVTLSSKEKFPFPEFLDSIPLHPILREMFTHYIGNDVYGINLIVGSYILLESPESIPLEDIQKIINHTRTIREFMNRLREATSHERNTPEPQARPKEKNKQEIFFKVRSLLAKEFELNEEKIKLESRFDEDLGLDSVDAIQVVMALEREFDFEIPDADTEKILTVEQAVDYVYARLNPREKRKKR